MSIGLEPPAGGENENNHHAQQKGKRKRDLKVVVVAIHDDDYYCVRWEMQSYRHTTFSKSSICYVQSVSKVNLKKPATNKIESFTLAP